MSEDGAGTDEPSNPYAPSNSGEERHSGFVRIYLWLNATLVLLPILVPVALNVVGIAHARDAIAPDGDPIVYQHYYYIEPNVPALLLYFGLPNGICAWLCRKTKGVPKRASNR